VQAVHVHLRDEERYHICMLSLLDLRKHQLRQINK
jgi:hypothetical protein